MSQHPPQQHPGLGLTFLLATLAAVGPFSIDTYLPAFPEMASGLEVGPLQIQQTLSIYLLTFGLMTLWHGALSDSFGRRRVILTGLGVYALASLGCTLANQIETLWLMRALQGLSAGAGMVVSRAMVRDLYQGPDAQRLISHIAIMFALAPAIAPLIGGWVLGLAGWRAVFAFLTLAACLLAWVCWRWLPESLPVEKRQPLAPSLLFCGYKQVLGHGSFFLASAGIGIYFGGFFLYVLSAPVFIRAHLGLGATDFHWLFVPAMLGMMGGSWLSGRVAGHWSHTRILAIAFAVMGAAALGNVMSAALLPPQRLTSVLPVGLYTLGTALAMPVMTLRALDLFPDARGMAASCQSFLQTLVSASIAAFLAPALWHSRLSLALGMTLMASIGGLMIWLHLRRSPPEPEHKAQP